MSLSDTPLPPFVYLSFSHLLSVYLSSLLTSMKITSHDVIIKQFSKNVNKPYTIYACYHYLYNSFVRVHIPYDIFPLSSNFFT